MAANKWPDVKVGELGQVITGRTPSTDRPSYFGDDFPFITPGDMRQGKYARDSLRGLSHEGVALLNRILLPANSVCVSCIGWQMGEVIMTDRPSITNQQINTIVPNGKVDPSFLYYSLRPRKQELLSLGATTGVRTPILNKSAFCETKVKIPPLSVQHRIAGILSAYDDLIENSQRRIQILEKMARALYREWFVHFRFPGFENHPRVDSALGQVPQGWEVKKLGDLITYKRRPTKPGPDIVERRYVPIDCIPPKSLALLEARPIEEAQSSLQLFEKGDILFGAMRPYFHKVVVAPFDGVTRTTCFVFKPVKLEWHAFATMTAFNDSTVAYANAHSQGATIPYAVWDGSLSEMAIVLPSPEVLHRFEEATAPMLALLAQSFFTLGNLRRTRDLLLPRLLSGQINVEAS